MNVIVIASIVVVATFLFGVAFAILFSWLGKTVVAEAQAAEAEKSRYNPGLTMGHKVPLTGDTEEQLAAARKIAAKQAASLPRGYNMRIGTFGDGEQPTAFDGIKTDPISAVKMARFRTWQGLVPSAAQRTHAPDRATHAPAETIPSTKSPSELVPGKDYAFIEITDDMSPAEKRKARIANAKARSAAAKVIKEVGEAASDARREEVTPSTGQFSADRASVQAGKVSVTRQPEAGVDYEVIEITDEMDPDAVRKARIANAKARSAAMKKIKEAGGAPSSAETESATTQAEAGQAAVKDEKPAPSIPSNVALPDYIEITETMDPGEVRRARIHNAKARSAYNKALKEAGIDPSEVSG